MISNVIKNLLHTNIGKIILSIILGLGLSTLFRQICNSKNCHNFIGPKHNLIRDQIFSYNSDKKKCYKLKEELVTCNTKNEVVAFSDE